MNINKNLLEDYVNFLDTTTKQKIYIFICFYYIFVFIFFLLFKNLNEYYFFLPEQLSRTGKLDSSFITPST